MSLTDSLISGKVGSNVAEKGFIRKGLDYLLNGEKKLERPTAYKCPDSKMQTCVCSLLLTCIYSDKEHIKLTRDENITQMKILEEVLCSWPVSDIDPNEANSHKYALVDGCSLWNIILQCVLRLKLTQWSNTNQEHLVCLL
jgi:hypothetical protein